MLGDRCASPSQPGHRHWHLLALAAVLISVLLAPAHAEPKFPELTGRIVDEAGLLSGEDDAAINAELAALEEKSTDQLTVVTLKSLQGYAIEDFGYQLGRHWGIGQKGKDNGVLLIVAPSEHKVRIEVGRGLEPVLTDALSNVIIQNAILPEFRRGDYAAGIRAGVRDIKDVLLGDAEAVKERAKAASRRNSQSDTLQLILFLFWAALIVYIIWAVYRSSLSGQSAVGRRRRRGGPVVVPGNSGSWGGGWSGGGDSGGGGWSGGGGDFGGGGSSGSW
jgi:uncharacterized protein